MGHITFRQFRKQGGREAANGQCMRLTQKGDEGMVLRRNSVETGRHYFRFGRDSGKIGQGADVPLRYYDRQHHGRDNLGLNPFLLNV